MKKKYIYTHTCSKIRIILNFKTKFLCENRTNAYSFFSKNKQKKRYKKIVS